MFSSGVSSVIRIINFSISVEIWVGQVDRRLLIMVSMLLGCFVFLSFGRVRLVGVV